jgi:hypothetical protein
MARTILTILLCSAVGVGWVYATQGSGPVWWSAFGFLLTAMTVAAALREAVEHGALRAALVTLVSVVVAIAVVRAEGTFLVASALGVVAGALVSLLRREWLPRLVRGTIVLSLGVTVVGVGAEVYRGWRVRADAERARIERAAFPTLTVPSCDSNDDGNDGATSRTPAGHWQQEWRGAGTNFTVTRTCYREAAWLNLVSRGRGIAVGIDPKVGSTVRAHPDGAVFVRATQGFELGSGPKGEVLGPPSDPVYEPRRELFYALVLASLAWLASVAQRRHSRRRLESLARAVDGDLYDGWFSSGGQGVLIHRLLGFRGEASDFVGDAFAWGVPGSDVGYRGVAAPRCVAHVGRREDVARSARLTEEMTAAAALLGGCVAAVSTGLVWLG